MSLPEPLSSPVPEPSSLPLITSHCAATTRTPCSPDCLRVVQISKTNSWIWSARTCPLPQNNQQRIILLQPVLSGSEGGKITAPIPRAMLISPRLCSKNLTVHRRPEKPVRSAAYTSRPVCFFRPGGVYWSLETVV